MYIAIYGWLLSHIFIVWKNKTTDCFSLQSGVLHHFFDTKEFHCFPLFTKPITLLNLHPICFIDTPILKTKDENTK